ncbi:suppressor of fused domain protein [Aquimarina aquimarini]|uniref:suppressor of fused domain protein n=1 Tax=Aquimarina aquimarini TaxID=1191734 RepID=UPI00131EE0C3|nr:suppressor of fused domain protein [Aquimarina aquimarini]
MDCDLRNKIIEHYEKNWRKLSKAEIWDTEKVDKRLDNFEVLVFKPNKDRDMWTYATCGMSTMEEDTPIELHIFSKKEDNSLIELLTAIAYYHREMNLNLSHTVNFGRPWQEKSKCNYGLISLPYLDGPNLESLYIPSYDENLKFYWLIPITQDEVEYKKKYGMEGLEDKLDEVEFNYLDPNRLSVVS